MKDEYKPRKKQNNFRKGYIDFRWFKYADKIKARDDYKCRKCRRTESEVTLQIHHTLYRANYKPYEYPLDECITLCKGCHAALHGKLPQPKSDWTLLYIEEKGAKEDGDWGKCERLLSAKERKKRAIEEALNRSYTGGKKEAEEPTKCNVSIKYLHHSYHPAGGYAYFGSTCIDYLTDESKEIATLVKVYREKRNALLQREDWREYLVSKHEIAKEITIRGYGYINVFERLDSFSFQITHKDEDDKKKLHTKSIEELNPLVKDFETASVLAHLAMMATIASEKELEIYRDIYKHILQSLADEFENKTVLTKIPVEVPEVIN